jgi:predicted transcriptional regulator
MTKLFVMSKIAAPTSAELAILRVLWTHGPATVRQINDIMRADRQIGYSTTLKMVQIMTEKGLLLKDESVRPQVYKPARAEARTQLQLIDELIQRAFGGSASKLVLRAAAAKRITPDELAEIKKLIESEEKPASNSGRNT